jgi:guanosine-3',5'-bis(diphosphate) 3'-pyrophosphohydrolase
MVPADVRDELHLSFLEGLPLAHAAVEYAASRHAGQQRPADHAAFVLHPVEVAALLARSGYPDYVVAAAVLHDVLEDTDAERGELEASFGAQVAGLVAAVSDDPAIDDEEERKDELRERVRELGDYPAALYAADKISKVRELRTLLATGARHEDIEPRVVRNRKSLEMLQEAIPGSRLVEVLRFELEALQALPPERKS